MNPPNTRALSIVPATVGAMLVVMTTGWHAWMFFMHGPMPSGSHGVDMVLIAVGVLIALGGLLAVPVEKRESRAPSQTATTVALCVLTFAMIVDISKTATLGFVLPGMRLEYGLTAPQAGLLPVCGLAGTVLGSLVWGPFVDRLGVRRTLLLATLGFIATSVCGSMPTFGGNLLMCGLMGFTVGGLVPVVFSAVTVLVPARRVPAVGSLVAGIATAGGYLMASQSAALFGPDYGWRALWLIGAFTGGLLLLVLPLVPGRCDEGVRQLNPEPVASMPETARSGPGRQYAFFGFMSGLVTLGVLTWVPSVLHSAGLTGGAGEKLLAAQAWVALPAAVVLALVLRRHAAERCALVVATGAGVALVVTGTVIASGQQGWLLAGSLTATVLFSNAMVAAVVPMASVHFASRVRGQGIGRIAGASKLGGLAGPLALASVITAPLGFFAVAAVVGGGTIASGVAMARSRPESALSLPDEAGSGRGESA
jgi:hypothetical protein